MEEGGGGGGGVAGAIAAEVSACVIDPSLATVMPPVAGRRADVSFASQEVDKRLPDAHAGRTSCRGCRGGGQPARGAARVKSESSRPSRAGAPSRGGRNASSKTSLLYIFKQNFSLFSKAAAQIDSARNLRARIFFRSVPIANAKLSEDDRAGRPEDGKEKEAGRGGGGAFGS